MARQSLDQYFLDMLPVIATRATCRRRQVAAIITDVSGHILSTGFNGVPSGYPHCVDMPCPGAADEPGNTSNCMAIHAEQNAIIQCTALERAHVIYCSTSPCFVCCKLIANTRIRRVVYETEYADARGLVVLHNLGRELMSRREVETWQCGKGTELP
jgi:dCMP deaminase